MMSTGARARGMAVGGALGLVFGLMMVSCGSAVDDGAGAGAKGGAPAAAHGSAAGVRADDAQARDTGGSAAGGVLMEPPAREQAGLHNVLLFSDGVVSGSQPHGEEGFDSLKAMGIRTVISVDGARPDLEAAAARGMRYVHVPIQYSGMEERDKLAMAAAIADLPRPIYVHCHHGKHRGPSAAAIGLVQVGEIDHARADALLHEAGLSVKYPGLWHCVGTAGVVDEEWLPDASQLPEYEEVTGMVAAMAVADRAWDNLKLIRDAGWATPSDHPDLVPAAEAGMLREAFRGLDGHDDVKGFAADFQEWLRVSIVGTDELEAALVEGRVGDAQRWSVVVEDACAACHKAYRNE